jgi:hypothetical protein
MNYSNRLLNDGSPEQAKVLQRGFRFSRDKMRLEL